MLLLLLWLLLLLLFTMLLFFLEITLMESDTLSDDLVETQTFDLSGLELDKVCHKTFKFCQVFLTVLCHFYSGPEVSWFETERLMTGRLMILAMAVSL